MASQAMDICLGKLGFRRNVDFLVLETVLAIPAGFKMIVNF